MSQASLIGYMPYVAGYLASLIGLFSWLILRRRANATVLAYVVLLAPTAMLLSGASGFEYGVLISVVAVSVGGRVLRSNVGFNVLAAVISAIAFVDAIVYQGHLTGSSMLGYTPSEGARYYGIGNEVMGLWIGAATYVCCKVAEMPKWRTWALVLAVAVIFALGLPGAGAKAGGFLVGLITLAAALWTRSGRVVRPGVAIIGGVGVLVAGVVALIVMGKLFGASHVTQTVAMAHSQGIGAIGSVIGRKAGMDAHLVFHSVWMIVLLVASVSTFVALRPIWRSPDLPRTEVVALITATAASFLLNDAGVVAAALCSLTLWCSAMLLLQRYRLAGDQRQIQAH